jgi:hypothetical protein
MPVTGEGLDVELVRQSLKAGDEKPQEPLQGDPHGATAAS